MKWPHSLTVIRHGQSAYNALKYAKAEDADYAEFQDAYNNRQENPQRAAELARKLVQYGTFQLGIGDHNTALTDEGKAQAIKTGSMLSKIIELPDIIFVSPYERTVHTLDYISEGWPALAHVKCAEEERLREQEHGAAVVYSDWRIFHVLHPEQEQMRDLQGPYWYRYPQGENIPDVRERTRSWLGTITRDFHEKNVMAVTHHLSILALRANLERFGEKEFRRLDDEEKPVNCGVTIYDGLPEQGQDGRLLLREYNNQLY